VSNGCASKTNTSSLWPRKTCTSIPAIWQPTSQRKLPWKVQHCIKWNAVPYILPLTLNTFMYYRYTCTVHSTIVSFMSWSQPSHWTLQWICHISLTL
jgi:hypothetical protein